MSVKVKDLVKSPWNVRKSYIEETVVDLAESISKEGMVSRIVIREVDGGKFEVLAGGRRVEALRHLYGEDHEIPDEHLIVKKAMTDFEALSISLSENVHRISFSSIELAEAAEKAKKLKPGISSKEIAKMLWTTDARVKRLLGVASDIGSIPARAKEEMSLPDDQEPMFTDAHWDAVRKGSDGFDGDQIKDVCDYIMDKEIPPARVGEVLKRFEEVDDLIDGKEPKAPEEGQGEENPFEEKFKGQLRLVDEGGVEKLYCCGKGEDTPIDLEHFREYLKASDKFKVFFQGKLTIKPLE